MSEFLPQSPFTVLHTSEEFVAIPGAMPLYTTLIIKDATAREFSLRLETVAYHDYMVAEEASEPVMDDPTEPEPVFIVPGTGISRELIDRILRNEIIIDYLVEQSSRAD